MLIVCLPTYNERDNLERWCARSATSSPAHEPRRARARDRRRLARRDRASSPTGSPRELPFVSVSCTEPRKEGLGPAYLAGFRAGARRRRRTRAGDGLRLLTRPGRRAAARGRRRRAPTSCSARATCLAAASANWGLGRRSDQPLRLALRAGTPRLAGARPHRRLQVLPPRACSRRSTSTRISAKGYAFQIETTYRAAPAGFRVVEVPIVFVRSRGGRLEDEPRQIVLEAVWRVPALRLAALLGRL